MAENNKDKNKLPNLALEIKRGLDLAEKGKQDRIKGLVDAAIALREARLLIKADIRFNKWCIANEFGPDVLNGHDRAALIAMGADPERMRSLLTNSERQSARYVYQHEWSTAESDADNTAGSDDSAESRFGYVGKPQDGRAQKKESARSQERRSRRMSTEKIIDELDNFLSEESELTGAILEICDDPDTNSDHIKNIVIVLANALLRINTLIESISHTVPQSDEEAETDADANVGESEHRQNDIRPAL